jgi:hypothetical protein
VTAAGNNREHKVLNAIAGWNEPITKAWMDNKCAVMAVSPFAMYRGEHKMEVRHAHPIKQDPASLSIIDLSLLNTHVHFSHVPLLCHLEAFTAGLLSCQKAVTVSQKCLPNVQVPRISSGLTSGKLPSSH